MDWLRIALAQIDTKVGDLEGNVEKVLSYLDLARDAEADIVAFPEMAITGYPPEDLLLKPDFIEANLRALEQVVAATRGLTVVVGFAGYSNDDIFNAAAVAHDGQLAGVYHKHYLPNYGVFDEDRYFQGGERVPVFVDEDVVLGISICEDIWYPSGPHEMQALLGHAQVLINISASPYHVGKGRFRERMLATRAADNVAVVAFCNLVGGQDELVFDGGSVIFDPRGDLIARGKQFAEELVVADVPLAQVFRQRLHDPRRRKERMAVSQNGGVVERIPLAPSRLHHKTRRRREPSLAPLLPFHAEIYQALLTGTRDYVRKNGFQNVVIGLSGGIDSALTAAIAADALGPEHVTGVSMPSVYSSDGSKDDAKQLAENLGIRYQTIPIHDIFQSYLGTLEGPFAGTAPNVAEENLQARVRGNLLMALSNKFGWIVLTTGNKSELSVGYATLYGDMAGGFAVIKDVPKTLVYELARYRNTLSPVIPENCLTKPPSAELRPDQKDTDSLPPYEILDPILHAYIEEDQSVDDMIAGGMEPETVRRVTRMVDRNEYKRRQAPPGVKITTRAFGKDRRLPITSHYGRRSE
ncbi:MAG: NAD+ synthase [Chloroflexi bacterium]|nr:NAD+ synthase [Chloroflexota bacterium]